MNVGLHSENKLLSDKITEIVITTLLLDTFRGPQGKLLTTVVINSGSSSPELLLLYPTLPSLKVWFEIGNWETTEMVEL